MLINVRLFARLREIAGSPEVRLELPGGSRVQDAWALLRAEHPEMDAYSTSISCAVNEEYARMHATLADGDEVAFLPPVSGG